MVHHLKTGLNRMEQTCSMPYVLDYLKKSLSEYLVNRPKDVSKQKRWISKIWTILLWNNLLVENIRQEVLKISGIYMFCSQNGISINQSCNIKILQELSISARFSGFFVNLTYGVLCTIKIRHVLQSSSLSSSEKRLRHLIYFKFKIGTVRNFSLFPNLPNHDTLAKLEIWAKG